MIIAITRTYGNRYYTTGVMTVPGTEFRCKTLELRAPEHSSAVNKCHRHAVPCGDYKCFFSCTSLMIMTPRTGRIRGYGRAMLVNKNKYTELTQGDIILCSSVDSSGKPTIVPAIPEALSKLIYDARVSEGAAFELTMSITEDADFCYVTDYVETPEQWSGSMDFTDDE